ncbi:MAG: phospho-N-acetylmuramoyl-pentapeptide-transferase [Candidatus Omnitrophota bacterium]
MLYYLLFPLRDIWFGFNIFRYITFRAAMASVTAFIISIVIGPVIIRLLASLKIGQNIRKDYVENLYELHKHKEGTPTMGGFIILLAVVLSTVAWARLDNRFILLCLISMLWFGFVGFVDDYLKMIREKSLGLRASAKLVGQVAGALLIAWFLFNDTAIPHTLCVPFFKDLVIVLGVFYIPFVVLVIVSASNAVNLTDGLDGLAIGCVAIIALTFAVVSYITGNIRMSEYLNVFYLAQSGELTVLCASIAGAGLGFLWFNAYPASVFMGDTGSLPLGGIIGVVAVMLKKEIALLFVGGIFVAEVLSVMMQVFSVQKLGRKMFRMTPLHHHFQLGGIHESKVIIRFWIVAVILALFTLSTLKMR